MGRLHDVCMEFRLFGALFNGVSALDTGECVLLFSSTCNKFSRLSWGKPGASFLNISSAEPSAGAAE
jgi:hypothetical protein